jgi:histidinol-phosphatase (PHP family)
MKSWANFHTHTNFSDGKNTPEEMVEYAIEQGFCALGFSDHATTAHDLRYCMQNEEGYIAEINRLKRKYAEKIQIYLGVEEDGSQLVDRSKYDYIIGSLHYLDWKGENVILDSTAEHFLKCAQTWNDDLAMAKAYYDRFIAYLERRKPDLIGHFDLIAKYDETEQDRFLHDERYWEIAENAVKKALEIGSIFEVNTGLITRGYRTNPCPHERLLKMIAQNGGRVTLSSDAHCKQNLRGDFQEVEKLLKSVGFDGSYILYNGKWQKQDF